MQKKLGEAKMTQEVAQEIVADFAKCIQQSQLNTIYNFQEILPWDKSDIFRALLFLVERSNDASEREKISLAIAILDEFGPNPDEYAKILELKNFMDELPALGDKLQYLQKEI